MRRARVATIIAGAALLSTLAVNISAHHSFAAEFDAAKPVTLRGTITRIERVNPHGWIYVDVKTPDGKIEKWAIETGAPNALAKAGIRKDSMPIGVEIIIKGYRAKDGSLTANGQSITLPDGTNFGLGSSFGAPDTKKSTDDEGYK